MGEYTFRTRPNTQEEALIWITALKAKSKSTWSINNTRKAALSVLFKVSKVLTTGSLRWAWCIGLGNYAVAEPNPVHPLHAVSRVCMYCGIVDLNTAFNFRCSKNTGAISTPREGGIVRWPTRKPQGSFTVQQNWKLWWNRPCG